MGGRGRSQGLGSQHQPQRGYNIRPAGRSRLSADLDDTQLLAALTALAGGAILSMLADTMIPEAFERTHLFTGLITALGFLVAFAIDRA